MGIIVMIIMVAIYVFILAKEKDLITDLINNNLEFLTDIVGDKEWLSILIIGLVIAFISWIFWPLMVALLFGIFLFAWLKDKEAVKQFFRELF